MTDRDLYGLDADSMLESHSSDILNLEEYTENPNEKYKRFAAKNAEYIILIILVIIFTMLMVVPDSIITDIVVVLGLVSGLALIVNKVLFGTWIKNN